MNQTIKLKTSDGVIIDAYRAEPAGKPKGGIVVLQEVFGVNAHIRRVADGFAGEGYLAIAPALFDRAKPGVEPRLRSGRHSDGCRLCRSDPA